MNHQALPDIDLFFGDANAAETRIYARLASGGPTAGLKLAGKVTGPYSAYAQTLPATIPLVDAGPGKSLLAQAIVPDPCFWSPEYPYWYMATVELRQGQRVLTTVEQAVGIRPLGARDQRFWYEGQPWVLRGANYDVVGSLDFNEWHNASASMLVENPSPGVCDEASRLGVLLAAYLPDEPFLSFLKISEMARWPAVGLIVVPTDGKLDPKMLRRAPNVVFAQRFAAGETLRPANWAHAVMCEVDSIEAFAAQTAECRLPVIAYRPGGQQRDVAAARRLCDLLQRDLAGGREIAGYIV